MFIARVKTLVDAGDVWCKCTSELLRTRRRRRVLTDINCLTAVAPRRDVQWLGKKIGSLFHLRLSSLPRDERGRRENVSIVRGSSFSASELRRARVHLTVRSSSIIENTILDPISPCVPPNRRRVIHECYVTNQPASHSGAVTRSARCYLRVTFLSGLMTMDLLRNVNGLSEFQTDRKWIEWNLLNFFQVSF